MNKKNNEETPEKSIISKSFFSSPYFIIAILSLLIIFSAIYIFSQQRKEGVTIESFTPVGEVPQTTNFTIEFSRDLVSDSLVNIWLDEAPINFKPSIQGKFQWIDRNKIRFYPEVMLKPSTEYTVEISPRIAASSGYSLKGNRHFKFHTERFRVNSASLIFEFLPTEGKQGKLYSTIEFNYDVEPETAIKYISLQYKDGGNIPFTLLTTSPGKIISLESEPIKRSERDKEVQLKIAKGLLPIEGNLGLEHDFIKPVVMPKQQKLIIERIKPIRVGTKRRYVRIQFNMPIDAKKAAQFIRVEPSLKYRLTSSHHYLDLKGNFEIGKAYQITIRKGIRGIDGSQLEKDFLGTVTFRKENLPPQIDFVGEGFYLTRSGNLNIGLSTINVDKVVIEVEKIFVNNLIYLLNENDLSSRQRYYWYNIRSLGERIYESDLLIQKVTNDEVITPINIRDFLNDERVGIFNVTARDSRERWVSASKWVMATDMGIMAKKTGNDIWVWVNSLTTLKPVQNAEVKLFSQNNQILATGQTNSEGIAVLKAPSNFKDEFTPYLITASFGKDLCFLELTRRQISTSDFNVGGDTYLEHGYEAYLYNERGVYRPGEKAHLAGIVREENATVPAPFPVIFHIKDPDGKIIDEQRAKLNEQGAVEFTVFIPDYAKTGKYTALLMISESEEIGRTSFNVEEFVPDRIKVKLATDNDSYKAGQLMNIKVEAVTLFGPPAAGRQVQAEIEIEELPFSPPNWKSFTFSDDKKSFSTQQIYLGDQVLDDHGKYEYHFDIPDALKPPSSLRGIISATVLEPGGRGVSAYRSVIIHPYETYIGLRMAKKGYATPNQDTKIQYIVLTPDNAPIPNRNLQVSLYRVYWHSILKRTASHGRYQYVSEKVEELVQQFTVSSQSDVSSFTVRPEEYGKYRVVVTDPAAGSSSSLSFYASGWGYSPWAMDNPDKIYLDLDKESYLPGETVKIQVRAPFTGKLLLTVEREKIFYHQVFMLTENTATLEIPVSQNYKPNAYISAHLIRSTKSLDRDTPVRAFGVVPLNINNEANRLSIDIISPDEIRPKKELVINISVKGQRKGRPYVTIAAVDEGICQLTDFQTPDAHAHFFGKKRLSVESYDIYSMILPEIESTLSSTAGDFLEARRKKHITPISVTRVKPVAFWSGLIKTDRKGKCKIKFKIPQFNGSLRLMAVAFADDKFGNFEKKIFVREPIVLTPTFPRFVASGDEFIVPVTIYNGTGSKGNFQIKLQTEGPVKITSDATKTIQINQDQEGHVSFRLTAKKTTGKLKFKLFAKGGNEKTDMSVEIPLRPPVPFTTLSDNGSLTQDSPISFQFPGEWIPGTANFSLTISSFPAVKFTRSLQYLLSYPHGCIEQTTSKLFPLLYFKDIARVAEPELFEKSGADYFLEQGITKLENMQLPSGAFSYWPQGNYINNWSSIYASHFLAEARRAGYVVSDRVYRRMLSALRSYTRDYRDDDKYSYQTAIYACYVLALAGKPDKSSILYFKNNLLDKIDDFSQYQLAGAFALSGDLQTARSLLPKMVAPIDQLQQRETGRNFNSPIRARAIMLDILAEVDPTNPSIPVLVKLLTEAASKNGRWFNTQENAFAFLALGKILKKQSRGNYSGFLTIQENVYKKFDTGTYHFSDKNWGGKKVTISIQGDGTCYYSWQTEGMPSTMNIDEYDRGLRVRRHYLNEEGIPINNRIFRQGDLVIAKITIKSLNESLDNVAVVDMLPAGFEIENPRLQSRKGINWISDSAYHPVYMDIRDDRLIFFGNFRRAKEETFYYALRAVTRGNFILPPIRAEAMYAPMKASVASSGKVIVEEQ